MESELAPIYRYRDNESLHHQVIVFKYCSSYYKCYVQISDFTVYGNYAQRAPSNTEYVHPVLILFTLSPFPNTLQHLIQVLPSVSQSLQNLPIQATARTCLCSVANLPWVSCRS